MSDHDLTPIELLARATSLLDLSDSLEQAIEQNFHEATRLHDALTGDQAEDPRRAMEAHGRVSALVDHAVQLLRAQGRELSTLTIQVGTKLPA